MVEESNLPHGWYCTSLENIATWGSGGTPSRNVERYFQGTIPWIKTGELGTMYIKEAAEHITEEALNNSSAKIFPKGAVGIAMYGATIGKLSIWGMDASTNQACAVGVPTEAINNEFLYYFLLAEKQKLIKAGKGGAQPNISQGIVKVWPINLPPLPEQNRIVAKIEELFSELDKSVENLKTARAQLKVYRQALLKHAFVGKGLVQKRIIAQPFGEECIFTLGDVIQTLGQGWSPRCLETPSQGDHVWGVIRTTAIQPLHFDDTKNKQLPNGLAPKPHLEIISGDVLITRAGPRTRVGIACFVKNTRPKLMVCDKAYRLQVDKEKILPQYLVMLLNTSEVLHELEKLKSGISDSGLNLTQDKFLMLKIRVPTLEHQKIILDDIEAKLSEADQLDQTLTTSLQQAEALRLSILKKAFSGQLVSQDPHDEPAAALLARIKAERANIVAKSSKKSRGT